MVEDTDIASRLLSYTEPEQFIRHMLGYVAQVYSVNKGVVGGYSLTEECEWVENLLELNRNSEQWAETLADASALMDFFKPSWEAVVRDLPRPAIRQSVALRKRVVMFCCILMNPTDHGAKENELRTRCAMEFFMPSDLAVKVEAREVAERKQAQ